MQTYARMVVGPEGLVRPGDDVEKNQMGEEYYPEALGGAIRHAAEELGAKKEEARMLTVDAFAHAAGLLLLAHTHRIRMFGASARDLMERYVEDRIAQLRGR